jgi:predicted MFS family arabinose efflux permease
MASEEMAGVAGAGSRRILATICLAPIAALLISIAFGPFLPTIASELGTSVAVVGQIPALSMLGAAVLGLIAGPFADHYGQKRALLIGVGAVSASALLTALAGNLLVLVLAALVGAVSRALVQPVALAIAGAHFDGAMRARAIGWVVAAMSGAPIAGVPALTAIAEIHGWRVAFAALAVVSLLIVAFGRWALPSDPAPAARRLRLGDVLAGYAPLSRHRPTVGLIGSSFLRNVGTWVFFTYLGAFLIERHGLSVVEAGWGYTTLGVGFLAGSLLAGERLSALPLRPLAIAGAAAHGILIGGPILLPTSPVVILALMTVGVAVAGVGQVATTMLLASESPAGRATTMTLNQSSFSLGSAAGGALGGVLLVVGGYEALAVAVLVCCAGASLLVWFSRPRHVVFAEVVTEPNLSA